MVDWRVPFFKSLATAVITAACVGTADSGPVVSPLEVRVQNVLFTSESSAPANYQPPVLPIGPSNYYRPRFSLDIEPTYLRIPVIDLEEPVGLARVENDKWMTPEKGVVTVPYESAFRDAFRSQIWGHSRWHWLPGTFSELYRLTVGDELIISGNAYERLVDGSNHPTRETAPLSIENVTYAVYDISIVDNNTVYNHFAILKCPELSLLTSLKESRPGAQWIFPQTTLKNANLRVSGPLDDSNRYLYLLITAKMTQQSVERVGGQWVCD